MKGGEGILDGLAAREQIPHRVMVVAAHPDDETIGLGAQLCRFDDLVLVHVTDGTPRDGGDARRYGFASLGDYAEARRRELADALAAGEVRARSLRLDIADQEACRDLGGLARRFAALFEAERPKAVISHAYEGGHPDHDAAAFAVHAASRLVSEPPAVIEMALYHRDRGQRVSGRFLASPSLEEGRRVSPGREFHLEDGELHRKQAMIDSFVTQRWLLMQLHFATERLRIAPEYDFCSPPHPGQLHYETLGWDITAARWCQYAAASLAELGLAELRCL